MFKCLKCESDGGWKYPSIDKKEKWIFFGVVLEVVDKGKNVKPNIPAPFDDSSVLNRDNIKPYIHLGGQQVSQFPMRAVKI